MRDTKGAKEMEAIIEGYRSKEKVEIPVMVDKEAKEANPELMVIVIGGPGSGKSWLIRQLAFLVAQADAMPVMNNETVKSVMDKNGCFFDAFKGALHGKKVVFQEAYPPEESDPTGPAKSDPPREF